MPSRHPDVFIAGGGPAGLACAIAAAQQGLSVEVADALAPPIDKACGEGLMPDTLAALTRLGVEIPAGSSSAIFRGIRFLAPNRAGALLSTQADFPATSGRGMRRPLLHQLLFERATALGVRFNWQTVVQSIAPGPGTGTNEVVTSRHTVRPRFIIGADGHQSRIRHWAGLDRSSISARRIGLRQHFSIAPQDIGLTHVEVHWSDRGQAYVTPISDSEICVAFVARNRFTGVAEALSHYPQLRLRLQSARPSDTPRGSITFSRRLHRVTRNNVALIGDASGSVDAVTGEGLGLCFRQALALAEALRSNYLASYQQAHQTLQRLPHFMARTMLLLDSSPRLRSRALQVLERRPDLFAQMLRVHIGHDPIRVFGPSGLLATGALILAG